MCIRDSARTAWRSAQERTGNRRTPLVVRRAAWALLHIYRCARTASSTSCSSWHRPNEGLDDAAYMDRGHDGKTVPLGQVLSAWLERNRPVGERPVVVQVDPSIPGHTLSLQADRIGGSLPHHQRRYVVPLPRALG